MVKKEYPMTDADCPFKSKLVDGYLKKWANAELESEREGVDAESVYWRKKAKAVTKKRKVAKKTP